MRRVSLPECFFNRRRDGIAIVAFGQLIQQAINNVIGRNTG